MSWQYGQPDPNQPPGQYPPAGGGYPGYGQGTPYGQGSPYDQPPGGYPPAAQYSPPPTMYPQYGQYPAYSAGTNGLAIASLVLGFVQIFTWGLGSIAAIITGAIALNQIKRSGQSGRGMAIAGVILGSLGLLLVIVLIIVIVVAVHSAQVNCAQTGTC